MNTLDDISLGKIAPSSIKDDANIHALIQALDPELKLVTNSITQAFIISRIDDLDEKTLNYLAWQFHVDFYDLAGDIDMKRTQVKDSIKWHMKKGTAWAIVKALDMIGIDAEFINWYEYNGKPYTFRIKAKIRHDYYNYSDKERIAENIIRAINESKAARSLLDKLDARIIDEAKSRLYAGIASGISGNIRINPDTPKSPENSPLYHGIASGQSGQERVNINRPDGDKSRIYTHTARGESRDISLGVDLDTMQELLLQFERRIYDRIDAHEKLLMNEINARQAEINANLDEIKNLLLWDEREADA